MADNRTWDQEDKWWEQNFSARPYATGRKYDEFRPAYRYGFESGTHHMGRSWDEVDPICAPAGTSTRAGRPADRLGRTSRTRFGTPGTV